MTLKQLKHRIDKTTAALERERRKNSGIIADVGWGSGMRKVRTGPSFRRENELEGRLREYMEELKKLEETA